MSPLRRTVPLAFIAALLFLAPGCGRPASEPEDLNREAVESSLRALSESSAYRFRLEAETWISASGFTVYGSERGEGFMEEGEFSLSVLRSSPAGEDNVTIYSQDGQVYNKEGDEIRAIDAGDMPNRMYDPRNFSKVLSAYGTPVCEGEEQSGGANLRIYLLPLDGQRAQDILSGAAWGYFRKLRFDINCRIWVGEASSPPSRLTLEMVGYDPQEGLQRYRSLITLTPNPPA